MKLPRNICIAFLITIALSISVSAHSGRTDANGGHTDSSTGEYHYHHGYPAHDHWDIDGDGDIDCPYLFEDKTGNSSSTSSGNKSHNSVVSNAENPEDGSSSWSWIGILFFPPLWLLLECVLQFAHDLIARRKSKGGK